MVRMIILIAVSLHFQIISSLNKTSNGEEDVPKPNVSRPGRRDHTKQIPLPSFLYSPHFVDGIEPQGYDTVDGAENSTSSESDSSDESLVHVEGIMYVYHDDAYPVDALPEDPEEIEYDVAQIENEEEHEPSGQVSELSINESTESHDTEEVVSTKIPEPAARPFSCCPIL